MEKLVIHGGAALSGEVKISGAKNAALPILAATLLSEGKFNIANVPLLKDVDTMRRLLANLGITSNFGGEILTIENSGNCGECVAVYDLVRTMRASILVLGPMLAKNGRAKVALPGGCAIGERPVDLHITALEKMGAVIEVKNGYINASCQRLKGAEIIFDKVTVTGTENIIMAATLAEGKTIIRNAAKEPEVADLVNFLKAMGAQIQREGSGDIIIYGVNKLNAADYAVMNDRIEAGTFLAAVAACGGVVKITSCPVEFMGTIFDKLISCGLDINIIDNSTVIAKKEGVVISTDIQTAPYPGFPTDMQSQFMAVMLKCDGVSAVTESIFENRFMHVPEMIRMGADISLKGSIALVRGVKNYSGAPVMASDLRASAGLVIAALAADNCSEIRRIYHLDRGYERFEEKLKTLGADISRVKDEA